MPENDMEDMVALKIIPQLSLEKPRIYANFCVVRHSQVDFSLDFYDVNVTEEQIVEEEGEKKARVPVQVSIALPPRIIPLLIKALQKNYELYQERFMKEEEE